MPFEKYAPGIPTTKLEVAATWLEVETNAKIGATWKAMQND